MKNERGNIFQSFVGSFCDLISIIAEAISKISNSAGKKLALSCKEAGDWIVDDHIILRNELLELSKKQREKPSKYSSSSDPRKLVFKTIENDYGSKDIFAYFGTMAIFFLAFVAFLICAFTEWAYAKCKELQLRMK